MSDDQPIGALGGFPIRLAEFVGEDRAAYRRQYVPVKPSDRFVSGQQFEFTADLEFRDWVIDDFSGGIQPGPFWRPQTDGVLQLKYFHLKDNIHPTLMRDSVTTQETSGGNFDDAGQLIVLNETLWSADVAVTKWNTDDLFDDTNQVASGFAGSEQPRSYAHPTYDEVYLVSHQDFEIRKISTLENTPSNASHYAIAAGDPFVDHPVLTSFDGQVYALDGYDLYELDQTTADTRTLKADTASQYKLQSGLATDQRLERQERLATSDVGPIWYLRSIDGYVYVGEYNVGADTFDIINRIPVVGAIPVSVFWAFGFHFVSYVVMPRQLDASSNTTFPAYIYSFRGSQSSIIGPIPGPEGLLDGSDERAYNQKISPYIAGIVGDDLLVSCGTTILAYTLSVGAWSHFGYDANLAEADELPDRKSTRLNSSHTDISRMPSSA